MSDIEDQGSFRASRSIPACVVAIIAASALAGCELTSKPSPQAANDLNYFRDDLTGLCFAAIASQTYNSYKVVSIANVPCEAAFPPPADGEA